MLILDLTSGMVVLTAISVAVTNARAIPVLWRLRDDNSPGALAIRNSLAADCVINAVRGAADILTLNYGRRVF